MAKMTPEEEAGYALDYGLPRKDLPPAVQAEYDRLREDRLHERRERQRTPASEPPPVTGEDGLGLAGGAAKHVSPDPGLYADPGGQAGIRYWDGQQWSPLLPADLAGGQAGKFPAPVMSPLPEPDGSWQYAAAQASRLKTRSAGFAAAAVLALAAALVVHQGQLLYIAGLFALQAFRAWKARRDFLRLDQAARGAPVAVPDAAARARRAGILLAVWLVVTAAVVTVMVALYARDLSKPHADFTLAVLALAASCYGLLYTFGAWRRYSGLRQSGQEGEELAGLAGIGVSATSPPDEPANGQAWRAHSPARGGGEDIQDAPPTAAAVAWAATPLPSEVTVGFPLPADVRYGEPSPRRRRIVRLTVAGASVAAVMAVTAIVLGSSSAHKPVAAQARVRTPARTSTSAPAAQELTLDTLSAATCIQGPPDFNTASTVPDVVTVVPCNQEHLAEVFFFSDTYWPAGMAFPGNAAISHQADTRCRKAFRSYDGAPFRSSMYSYWYTSPWGRQNWNSGDRLLACFADLTSPAFTNGEPIYGSIKRSYS